MRRLEAGGIPKEQVSYFYRYGIYDSEMFVGRYFDPEVDNYGRFNVVVYWRHSGNDGVASRPRYEETEIVMRIDVPELDRV